MMKHFSSANHWAKYFIVFFHVFMNKIHNINEYNDKERWGNVHRRSREIFGELEMGEDIIR